MPLNSIIIEDEHLAANMLKEYVDLTTGIECIGLFNRINHAEDFLLSNSVDIIFLDIQLPGKTGIDFLNDSASLPHIVLTTAYHQYAVASYEYDVIDYLLKPIEYDRFLKSVSKIQQKTNDQYLKVKEDRCTHHVPYEEITHIESQRDYLKVYLMSGKSYKTKMPLKNVAKILPKNFIRVHRSFIVNTDNISSHTSSTIRVAKNIVPIGRKFKGDIQILNKTLNTFGISFS